MRPEVSHRRGLVSLVGAGPGDPGLITLRAVECIEQADLILYDYLVNAEVLQHARPDAQRVCLGRHGTGRIMPQEEINRRMVTAALEGRSVVRLKGGDPLIFARGAEECQAVIEAGLALEIVPGITAALAAGSYAGIPMTHRDVASCVAFVTGHECSDKAESNIDFCALAQFPGTLVFYMGVTTAAVWSRALIEAGKPAATPAAILRRISWPDQKVLRCSLAEVPSVLAAASIRPPAIILVGQVVSLPSQATWLSARPLFGQTVLVTRPRDQAAAMCRSLHQLGAQVLVQEAIVLQEPPDWEPVDRAIAKLDQFDWLVFSSANGVRFFLDRITAAGHDLRRLGRIRLAAIGPATAEALGNYRLRADLQPQTYRAEALAEALCTSAAGKRILLVRASRGREVLAQTLLAAGAAVEQVVAYTSADVPRPREEVTEALRRGQIDWITVTSSAIARSLWRLFADELQKTRLVSISPVTSEVLRQLGLRPAAEATSYTTEGVVEAILRSGAH